MRSSAAEVVGTEELGIQSGKSESEYAGELAHREEEDPLETSCDTRSEQHKRSTRHVKDSTSFIYWLKAYCLGNGISMVWLGSTAIWNRRYRTGRGRKELGLLVMGRSHYTLNPQQPHNT